MDKANTLVREIGERLLMLADILDEQPEPERNDETTPMMTVTQAAETVGVSPQTMRTWCMTGVVPGATQVSVGSRQKWVIPQAALETLRAPGNGRRVRKSPKKTAATARLRTRWTESEDAQLLRLLDEGLPHSVIGTMLRRSRKAVTVRAGILRSTEQPVAEPTSVELVFVADAPEPVIEHEREPDEIPATGKPQGLGLWGRFLRGEG